MNYREKALEWWDGLGGNPIARTLEQGRLTTEYYGKLRRVQSLTGFEIEVMFKEEVLGDVEIEEVEQIVERGVDDIFTEVHDGMNTKSGDITPEQVMRLNKIKADLVALVIEQAKQNL